MDTVVGGNVMLFVCKCKGREKWVIGVDSVMFASVDVLFEGFVGVLG